MKEKEICALGGKRRGDEDPVKGQAGGLPESEVEKPQAQQRTGAVQARLARVERGTLEFSGNHAQRPEWDWHVELFLALDLLPHGWARAGLSHLLNPATI